MFSALASIPPDPILGLMMTYQSDKRTKKIDLGVGVYRDEAGITPLMVAVHSAESELLQGAQGKGYQGMDGYLPFVESIKTLLLGAQSSVFERSITVQAPGGCGALRLGAELLRNTQSGLRLWVSDPTWGNHVPLLGRCGLEIRSYPYFDSHTKGVRFDAMMDCLETLGPKDVVLLHACCHNPTGADLNAGQWRELSGVFQRTGALPFVDMAYQGFGEGLEEDAYGTRLLAETLPEMLLASSCSKNFGLYRERVGAITVVAENSAIAANARGQIHSIARGLYSMPPAHGAMLAAKVMAQSELRAAWEQELGAMRQRIQGLRQQLSDALAQAGDFQFVTQQCGMFSFLGLTPEQVKTLQRDHGVYMTNDSRISIAGINQGNIDHLVASIKSIL